MKKLLTAALAGAVTAATLLVATPSPAALTRARLTSVPPVVTAQEVADSFTLVGVTEMNVSQQIAPNPLPSALADEYAQVPGEVRQAIGAETLQDANDKIPDSFPPGEAGAPLPAQPPATSTRVTIDGASGIVTPVNSATPGFRAKFDKAIFDAANGVPFGPTAVIMELNGDKRNDALPENQRLHSVSYGAMLFDTRNPSSGRVKQMDAGANHTCVLLTDSGVRCWGMNTFGQIGNGTTSDAGTATEVLRNDLAPLRNVSAIDVGTNHACAIVAPDGELWCWGDNANGQIAPVTDCPSISLLACPVQVAGDKLLGVVSVATGTEHTCAVLTDSTVRCWGRSGASFVGGSNISTPVKLENRTTLVGNVEVVAGQAHTCTRRADGSVWCWGDPTLNRLGGESNGKPNPVPSVSGATSIAAGRGHTCAVVGAGAICWGFNLSGQLGRGDNTTAPAAVSGLSSAPTSMALGASHSCFVVGGLTYCTGSNGNWRFGNCTTVPASSCGNPVSTKSPVLIPGLTGVLDLAAGDAHTCFVAPASNPIAAPRCAGVNNRMQLGDGTVLSQPAPVRTNGLEGAAFVAAGAGHTCVTLVSGTEIKCWGANDAGQLGTNNLVGPKLQPTSVFTDATTLVPANIYALEAGDDHTCLLSGNPNDAVGDTLTCWGKNSDGQLGDGTTTVSPKMKTITGVTPLAVALGARHSCGIFPAVSGARKSVKCWGDNAAGQLGDGTKTDRTTPTNVTGLTGSQAADIVAIDAGDTHTCAVLSDGTLRCWGSNTSEQLGSSSVAESTVPLEAEFIGGAKDVATSADSTCVTMADGTLQCFGGNSSLQLGYAGPQTAFPVFNAAEVSGSLAITSGGEHFCTKVASNLSIACWGENGNGQLGVFGDPEVTDDVRSGSFPLGNDLVLGWASGRAHTCAVMADSELRCWGANASGQIGDNSQDHRVPDHPSGPYHSVSI